MVMMTRRWMHDARTCCGSDDGSRRELGETHEPQTTVDPATKERQAEEEMMCALDASFDVRKKEQCVYIQTEDNEGASEGACRLARRTTRRSIRLERTKHADVGCPTDAEHTVDLLDPEAERQSLLQKMEVLNKMLSRVADEESEQLAVNGNQSFDEVRVREGKDGVLGEERNGSMYSSYSTLEDPEWLAGTGWDADQGNDGMLLLPSHDADLFLDPEMEAQERPVSASGEQLEGSTDQAKTERLGSCTLKQLRQKYKESYGRSTNSSNRQWLIRRLLQSEVEDADVDDATDRTSSEEQLRKSASDLASSRPEGKRKIRQNRRYTDFHASEDAKDGKTLQPKKLRSANKRHREEYSDGHGPATPSDSEEEVKVRRTRAAHVTPHAKAKAKSSASLRRGPQKKSTVEGRRRRAGVKKSAWSQEESRRLHYNPWTLEESEALVDGVACCGGGKWADIKKLGYKAIEKRSAVDLKDKWRNLMRIAMLPQDASKAMDKKREIPAALLARVRDLAARSAKRSQVPEVRSSRTRFRGD
mmetsp:Transcript_7683/g.47470  ORF Transcript_7683/g.47470 Transcript_7683/m.47470 type:complete len:532 (+) Transcript_7683:485-2080(+)